MKYRSEEMTDAEEFAELDRLRSEGKISDADYEEYKRMAAEKKTPPAS
jgi:hypothetical protein